MRASVSCFKKDFRRTREQPGTYLEEEREVLSELFVNLFAEEFRVGLDVLLQVLSGLEEGGRTGRVRAHPQLHSPRRECPEEPVSSDPPVSGKALRGAPLHTASRRRTQSSAGPVQSARLSIHPAAVACRASARVGGQLLSGAHGERTLPSLPQS